LRRLALYTEQEGLLMSPDQSKTINGILIEKFYWAGEYVVYVNHYLVTTNFEETCRQVEAGEKLTYRDRP
jgi:hypothetical protein